MADPRLTKDEIIAFAHATGFEDVGFTSPAPFDSPRTFPEARQKNTAGPWKSFPNGHRRCL